MRTVTLFSFEICNDFLSGIVYEFRSRFGSGFVTKTVEKFDSEFQLEFVTEFVTRILLRVRFGICNKNSTQICNDFLSGLKLEFVTGFYSGSVLDL